MKFVRSYSIKDMAILDIDHINKAILEAFGFECYKPIEYYSQEKVSVPADIKNVIIKQAPKRTATLIKFLIKKIKKENHLKQTLKYQKITDLITPLVVREPALNVIYLKFI